MAVCSVMISLKAGSISCSSVSSQYLLEHLALCTRSKDVMMDEHIAGEQDSKGWYHFFKDFFLMWTILKVFIEFIKYCFMFAFFLFCFGSEACGIWTPWPGIEPVSPALLGRVSVTGPPRKSPKDSIMTGTLFSLEVRQKEGLEMRARIRVRDSMWMKVREAQNGDLNFSLVCLYLHCQFLAQCLLLAGP